MHDFSGLNQYTGLLTLLCFIALFGCFSAIGFVANVVIELLEAPQLRLGWRFGEGQALV